MPALLVGLGAAPFVPLILGGRASYPAPPSLSAIAAALGLTVAIGLVFGTYPPTLHGALAEVLWAADRDHRGSGRAPSGGLKEHTTR